MSLWLSSPYGWASSGRALEGEVARGGLFRRLLEGASSAGQAVALYGLARDWGVEGRLAATAAR